MWRERFKGLVVIGIFALVALAVVQYYSSHKGSFNLGSFDPASLERQVLGVISKVTNSESQEELREEFAAPVKEVEQKANELIEEIKNLPQEQAEVVKEQLLKTVCQSPTASDSAEATSAAQEEEE